MHNDHGTCPWPDRSSPAEGNTTGVPRYGTPVVFVLALTPQQDSSTRPGNRSVVVALMRVLAVIVTLVPFHVFFPRFLDRDEIHAAFRT